MPSEATLLYPGGAFLSQTPDRIFTVEDFSSDEKMMISAAEQFSRNEVMTVLDRLDAQEEGLSPALIRKAGELGLCGVDTAEEYGGLGLGKNLAARILEYMSLNGSFSVTYGITSGISQLGLTLFGTQEQKSHYLPLLTSGEWIGAYALSEPNSGSDALSATTRAELRNGKWVLNGTKMWISNAKWADLFVVLAKVDGEAFSAFLVERDHPGVTIAREEHKLGLKGSSTARLVLEDAEIPESNLLHEVGKGHQVAFNALNIGRFKLSSMSLGPARDAMGHASAYANDRRQFGQPIANFGLVQKKFAEMAARFYAAESVIYRTGALIDEAFGLFAGSVEGNRRAAEEFALECSACKVLSTEAEAFIIDECLQVYGASGYTEEFPIARHYRDARVSRIYEGTNEINRIFLADRFRKRGVSLAASGDSFISEVTGRAMRIDTKDQVTVGAQSDLLLLAYAEQSARLRSKQVADKYQNAYAIFVNWANAEAARAFQTATGEAVALPAPEQSDIEALAEQVYRSGGPV
ncbi:MAG TPA: acyl-CoA dehydrogenase family protein [Fimbriimonadaceae bacterium]|nr:acyl-CoA dehydrogenase family protein [Fimbriimonadaceae bacterium]